MLLIAVATDKEIKPLARSLTVDRFKVLVMGMGPVAAAASLSNYLTLHSRGINGVLNIGVAGAYPAAGIGMLDICLAHKEFLGDFGICRQDGVDDFDPELVGQNNGLPFENGLVSQCVKILHDKSIPFTMTNFVTVNCSSATRERGEFFRKKFTAGCENMEGAAVAMVCKNFNIPCVELRCISNMVEKRNKAEWRLSEAIEKLCQVVGVILHGGM